MNRFKELQNDIDREASAADDGGEEPNRAGHHEGYAWWRGRATGLRSAMAMLDRAIEDIGSQRSTAEPPPPNPTSIGDRPASGPSGMTLRQWYIGQALGSCHTDADELDTVTRAFNLAARSIVRLDEEGAILAWAEGQI